MKNKFLSLGLVLTFALAVTAGLPSVSHAGALTSDQVQAIMSLLQSFGADQSVVNNVQTALTGGQSSGQSISASWCHTFNTNLRIGSSGDEVSFLQTVLQKEGLLGTTGNDKGSYDETTAAAVTGFQEKYRSDILAPAGLQFGTGFVGVATRAKLNALYGCGNTNVSQFTLSSRVVQTSSNGTDVIYTANLSGVLQRSSGNWSLSLSCPAGVTATAQIKGGLGCGDSATIISGNSVEVLFNNSTNVPQTVGAMAQLLSGVDGITPIATDKDALNIQPTTNQTPTTCSSGQTWNGSACVSNTTSTQTYTNATDASASASVVNSFDDHAGEWGQFNGGGGIITTGDSDWNISLSLTLGSAKTIKSITVYHTGPGAPSSTEGWSTASSDDMGRNDFPLVVFQNNAQLNTSYDKTFGPLQAGAYQYVLYGQVETPHWYGGKVVVDFTDGTQTTAPIFASSYVPPSTSATQPSITVLNPTRGANWISGTSQVVSWQTKDGSGNIGVFLTRASDGWGCLIGQTSLNSGSISVTPTIGQSCPNQNMILTSGSYYLSIAYPYVSATNAGGLYGDSSGQTIPITLTTASGVTSPSLTSVSPSSGIAGSNAQLTLYGTGLTASTQVSFVGPVGTSAVNTQVSALAAASDGTWLTVQTPTSLVPGTYNIRVINTNGESARVVFTVTQVQALSSLSVTDATPPSATIVPGTLGTFATFFVSVQGGSNVSVSGMSFHLANVSSDTSGASASLATGVVLADASGNVVAGPVTMGTDGTTNIVFSGPITFPNGTATYYLKGVLNPSYWATSAYTHISTAPSSSWTNPVNQGSGVATILTSSLVSGNVLVQPPVSSSSQQPTVSAGPDQTVTLSTNPLSVPLNGSVNANGYTGTINTIWTKVSGPSNVEFYNLSTGATTRYSPAGNAVFNAAGTYVLQLQASDSKGNTLGSDQTTIYVFQPSVTTVTTQPPTISTFSGPTSLTVGQYGTWNLLANFSASQGIVTAYQIDFGDIAASQTPFKGNISSGSQIFISKVYNVPGTYNITATVSVAPGVSASKTTSVVVSCPSGQTQSAAGQCVNVPAPTVSLSGSILGTYTSQAGAWNVFQPSGQPNWNWSAALSLTGNTAKTISSMIVTNSNGETWSTSNPGNYPLVVFTNGKQLDTAYGQSLGIYQPNQTYSFTLFGEIASQTLNSTTLMVQFSDGTSATANLGGATYKPTITNTATSYVQNNMTASAVDAWQSMINALRLENPELYR